ncbi:MAG: M20 family metallopeptidase [Aristaeellaceae bacterium]
MDLNGWCDALRDVLPPVRDIFRRLHRCPEPSGRETQTSQLAADTLTRLGIPVRLFEGCHSLMGVLRNGDGPCVAIRADMDALPILEASSLPYASERPGVMHACGHDAHTAMALGSAMWLAANRHLWRGTVKWLFESAEETTGDARLMVRQGCLRDPAVDVVIGQHVNPRYPAGTFFSRPGCVNGASDDVILTIRGRSGHGAYPESGVDAIVIAAQVLSALQTLISRELSPFDSAVLTFGKIQGGTAGNVICDRVTVTGTLRTLTAEAHDRLTRRIREMAAGIAAGMGGEAQAEVMPSYPPLYNDEARYAVVEAAAREVLGDRHIILREKPSLGVESFAFFLDDTPGVFYDIGCGVGSALHTDTFRVDEGTLLPGVALQCASVLAFHPIT